MVGEQSFDMTQYNYLLESNFKDLRKIVDGHIIYYYHAQLIVHMVTERLKDAYWDPNRMDQLMTTIQR